MPNPLELSRALEPELIEFRRDLHRHPEVAWQEKRTTEFVAGLCQQWGLEVRRLAGRTGLMATLNPGAPGPALALRADMDALPIAEENDVPYASTIPGKAHLCGHDAHTAMLLGAAKILSGLKEQLPFPLRFLFQPAEENLPGGARAFVEAGFLDGVSEIFGLHVTPQVATGLLGVRTGPAMASMDRFEVRLEGRGGHGAMPHLARDPICAAAELILALQTIVSRRVDPLEPAVVSVCQIQAGSAFNAIPQECVLAGTARSLSAGVHERLPQWIAELAAGVAQAHGVSAKTQYERGTPVLVNPASAVEKVTKAFRKLGGRECEIPATMGGEDFAYYLEKVPGCFAFLGAGNGTPRTAACLHHPKFDIDEKALAWGTALYVELALERAGKA
jgi:amidohydrolase